MSHKRKFLLGSASNVLKGILALLVTLVLPPLLVHRLSPADYSAWMLILQCSAYINLLDVSLQIAVGKFIAQYDAVGDREECSRIMSSSFALLCLSAVAGIIAAGIMTLCAPTLFAQVPGSVIVSLRMGLLVVGLSTAIALPSNAFMAACTGLQEYGISTVLAVASKVLSTIGLVILLLMHGTLVQISWLMAIFTLATGLSRYFGWRLRLQDRIAFTLHLANRATAWRLVKYSGVLAISTFAMLFVSGFDVVIVGHYDFKNTGYYALASEATTFMILVISAVFGPLIPAISSMQASRTAEQLGATAIKATRYCTLLICCLGLPLLFGAYSILRLWVGSAFAIHSAPYLQILVLGNAIRLLGYPYSLTVAATGKFYLATFAGILEAIVNFSLSIYLAQKIGAPGVAIGTLVGAFVSVGTHVAISMKYTRSVANISRPKFMWEGLFHPLLCIVPSLLLLPFWKKAEPLPAAPGWLAIWLMATCAVIWMTGLMPAERNEVRNRMLHLFHRKLASSA